MTRRPQTVTDAELAVLKVLWQRGPLTAKDITAAIYPDGAESEFASVHSFLQRLERKGLVDRDRSSFVHSFSAAVSQADVAGTRLVQKCPPLGCGWFVQGGGEQRFFVHRFDLLQVSHGSKKTSEYNMKRWMEWPAPLPA